MRVRGAEGMVAASWEDLVQLDCFELFQYQIELNFISPGPCEL